MARKSFDGFFAWPVPVGQKLGVAGKDMGVKGAKRAKRERSHGERSTARINCQCPAPVG